MRQELSEWYELGDDDLKRVLQEGTVALDANALLDLYRIGQKLRDRVLTVLGNPLIKPRLFVPYQAALEYQDNRLNVAMIRAASLQI